METGQKRGIRSYVLRQGRMTHGQSKAMESVWPRFGLTLEQSPRDLPAVFGNPNPVILEIGFGMGESLARQAADNPDLNYIGIEVHRPGVGHLLMLVEQQGLRNVRVFAEDTIPVLERVIPARSLAGIQVFFPDPWHKKRHHKRRLVNPAFLDLAGGRLAPGGFIHLATDWEPYAEHIREVFDAREDFVQVDPPARPETKFERRGVKLGHTVTDLAYALSGE